MFDIIRTIDVDALISMRSGRARIESWADPDRARRRADTLNRQMDDGRLGVRYTVEPRST